MRMVNLFATFGNFYLKGKITNQLKSLEGEKIQDNDIYSEAEDEPEFIEYDIETEEE